MPGQQQQQQVTTQVAQSAGGSESTGLSAQSRLGNAYLQEQLRGRQSPGQLSWQGALGEKLGGKLYGALSKQLTNENLVGHANKVVDSALGALRTALQGQVQPTQEEAVQLFLAEIDKHLKGVSEDAVVGSGLADGIRNYADVHPYEIALAAVAGAVAYVLSNQDLPLIEAKLGLGGGHSITGGIDPGRTMKLALEQVRIGYRYQGDHVAGYLNASKYQDGYSAEAGIAYAPSATTGMSLSGSHSDRAGVQSSKLDLRYQDPSMQAGLGFQRNVGGDQPGSSVSASIADRPAQGQLQRSMSGTYRGDGSWEAAAGVGKNTKDASWSVEAYAGEDAKGQNELGVRTMFKLRF